MTPSEPWKRRVVIGNATLYLGDCLEILPHLPKVDAVITDPPYGIAYKHSGKGSNVIGRERATFTRHSEDITGDDEAFDPTPWLQFKNVILWGANNYCDKLPSRVGRWLIWDKAAGRYEVDSFGDCEIAWHSKGKASRIFPYAWKGVYCAKAGENNGIREHPSMKPQGLMRWCITQVNIPGGTVLDPYMGSGSTGTAAIQAASKFVGIEIEPKYFEIACERIENAQRQERLFA